MLFLYVSKINNKVCPQCQFFCNSFIKEIKIIDSLLSYSVILGNSKNDLLLNLGKIGIITFMSFFLLGSIEPYYEGNDSFYFGVIAKNLSNGIYSISNELLETRNGELVGSNWLLTIENTIVPKSGLGFAVISSVFYTIGGNFGLFYFAPIFTILLLICSERISTKLFGKYVGLITLLFISTSNLLYRNSTSFQMESIFSLFLILGVYFLIKFLSEKTILNLAIASIFLSFLPYLRLSGIIFFPIEIIVLTGFLIMSFKKNNEDVNKNTNDKKLVKNYFKKNFSKILIVFLIPWMVFIIGYVTYYDNYFGNPLTNYYSINGPDRWYDTSPSSLIKFEKSDFDNAKEYSKYLLPYQFPGTYNKIEQNFDDVLGKEWLGVIALVVLLLTVIISLISRTKKLEIITLTIFVIGYMWLFASITTEERASFGVAGRYMLPVFTMTSMMMGFGIMKCLELKISNTKYSKIIKSGKITLVILLIIFFMAAVFFVTPVQNVVKNGFEFNDPFKFDKKYPLDKEGLNENSVIVGLRDDRAIEYGFISFNPIKNREISNESIKFLDEIKTKNYEIYVFKQNTREIEGDFKTNLVNNYGFILKEFSPTFCKVISINNTNAVIESDEKCIK